MNLTANIFLMKGMCVDKFVIDKKDVKSIKKGDSKTLANSVKNPLCQCIGCVIYM